jgi:hypothetical protein
MTPCYPPTALETAANSQSGRPASGREACANASARRPQCKQRLVAISSPRTAWHVRGQRSGCTSLTDPLFFAAIKRALPAARPTTSSARGCIGARASNRNSRHQCDSSRTTFPSNSRTDSRIRIQRHNTDLLRWRRTYSAVETAAAVGPENEHQTAASLPASAPQRSQL